MSLVADSFTLVVVVRIAESDYCSVQNEFELNWKLWLFLSINTIYVGPRIANMTTLYRKRFFLSLSSERDYGCGPTPHFFQHLVFLK